MRIVRPPGPARLAEYRQPGRLRFLCGGLTLPMGRVMGCGGAVLPELPCGAVQRDARADECPDDGDYPHVSVDRPGGLSYSPFSTSVNTAPKTSKLCVASLSRVSSGVCQQVFLEVSKSLSSPAS